MKKNKQLNKEISSCLVPVDESDIFYEKNGKLYLGGAELPVDDVKTLVAEARAVRDMFLFKLFIRNIRFAAYQRAMELSDNYEGVMFGKAMIYELKVLEQMVKDLAKMEVKN
jgi:hypothetical protein